MRSLGKTPLDLRLMTNIGEEAEFIFRLPGYEEATEKVTVTDNALYSIPLEKKRRAGAPVGPGGKRVIKVLRLPKKQEEAPVVVDPKRVGRPDQTGKGFLTVTTGGPARVFVDDRTSSVLAPLTRLPLAPGVHSIRVYSERHRTFSDTISVTIHAGVNSTISLTLD